MAHETNNGALEARCRGHLTADSTKKLLRAHRTLHVPVQAAIRQQSDVTYDLTKCSRMDFGALMLLFYCARLMKQAGRGAFVKGQGQALDLVLKNLSHLYLPRELRRQLQYSDGEFPLRGISKPNEMVKELEDWAESVRRGVPDADPASVALWQMQVGELTTNSFQHGRLGDPSNGYPILVAGRAFPQARRVQLATIDFGLGIPCAIRDLAQAQAGPTGDGDLILFACRKGITSRSVPQNQGSGLHSLVQTVKRNGGSLHIFSGAGLFWVKGRREYRRNLNFRDPWLSEVKGTLSIITLRLD